MGHPINSRRSRHSARARPTAASRTSPPWSVAEGSAAAADAKRQREHRAMGMAGVDCRRQPARARLAGRRASQLPTGGRRHTQGSPGEPGARHVPGSARAERSETDCRRQPRRGERSESNERPRADAVTGQTSDRPTNVHGTSTGAMPAGRFRSHSRLAGTLFRPISRQRASAAHRELTEGWRSSLCATAARRCCRWRVGVRNRDTLEAQDEALLRL